MRTQNYLIPAVLTALSAPLSSLAAQAPVAPVFENGQAQVVPAFADTP